MQHRLSRFALLSPAEPFGPALSSMELKASLHCSKAGMACAQAMADLRGLAALAAANVSLSRTLWTSYQHEACPLQHSLHDIEGCLEVPVHCSAVSRLLALAVAASGLHASVPAPSDVHGHGSASSADA